MIPAKQCELSVVVEEKGKFRRAFGRTGGASLRPVEHGGTKFDGDAVERREITSETEFLSLAQAGGKVGVGIGKGGTAGGYPLPVSRTSPAVAVHERKILEMATFMVTLSVQTERWIPQSLP